MYGLAVGGDFRRNTYNPFKAALLLYLCTVNLSTVFPKKNKQNSFAKVNATPPLHLVLQISVLHLLVQTQV